MIITKTLIAVVDDEESIRKALERLMRSAGFYVETFSSGAEFLQSIQIRRPDCVVLDLHMSHMNGFDTQVMLAESDMHIPVIIITGHDSEDVLDRAMEAHPAAYLRKPVDGQELLDAIAVAIANDSGQPETC